MWWLNAFFLVNGTWMPGAEMSPLGWSPRAYQSEAECEARRRFAERECRERPLEFKAAWVCSYGKALAAPPASLSHPDC